MLMDAARALAVPAPGRRSLSLAFARTRAAAVAGPIPFPSTPMHRARRPRRRSTEVNIGVTTLAVAGVLLVTQSRGSRPGVKASRVESNDTRTERCGAGAPASTGPVVKCPVASLTERHTGVLAVCRSSRRDASVDQAQDMRSNDTVTVPLAFRVACAFSWNCRCEPSEPVALMLKVECSTPLRRLFSSPNQFTKCPV